MLTRKAIVSVFVRHKGSCPQSHHGESYRGCECPKFLRYSRGGKQHRQSAGTSIWHQAEAKAAELQQRLDRGATGLIVKSPDQTIERAVETFISAKQSEGVRAATIRKLRFQLTRFQQFMQDRSKYFPVEISTTDVIEFRAGWEKSWRSGVTRQKAQQNLRGFLRSCCKTNLPDLLATLKPVRLTQADKLRLKPQPFSERELATLLAQVPVTFTDPVKIARMTALIHFMVATGTAIRDTVQLTRSDIKNCWLHFQRQKTGKTVHQKLDQTLCQELHAVASETYVFWNGTSEATSAVGLWQEDLRRLMGDAGVWIKGNLSHRFRDTAVDFWLSQGADLTTVAALIGDTLKTVERHYSDLASERMKERIARAPVRVWGNEASQ
jgi:site-specific recombinase XerD